MLLVWKPSKLLLSEGRTKLVPQFRALVRNAFLRPSKALTDAEFTKQRAKGQSTGNVSKGEGCRSRLCTVSCRQRVPIEGRNENNQQENPYVQAEHAIWRLSASCTHCEHWRHLIWSRRTSVEIAIKRAMPISAGISPNGHDESD